MRFYCDAMMGKLAVWLRIFGFDCGLAGEGMTDEQVIDAVGDRILLTRDKEIGGVLVPSPDPKEQMRFVVRKFNLKLPDSPTPNHCSKCNGKLAVAGDTWKCEECGQLFWEGSHWKKIREFAKDVQCQ